MHQSHSWIIECGRVGEGFPSRLAVSKFRDWFTCLWWSEKSPSIGVQIMAFWHTLCVGRQICPKRLVGLNYLQVYTATRVEQCRTESKIQTQYIF